jgi:hypothetical protein
MRRVKQANSPKLQFEGGNRCAAFWATAPCNFKLFWQVFPFGMIPKYFFNDFMARYFQK